MKARSILALTFALGLLAAIPVRATGPTDFIERYKDHPIGQKVPLTYFFGPYAVPPGQDRNLVTPDIPFKTGFITSVAPNLINAVTGQEPTEEEAHIHHAHWFRVTNDPHYQFYSTGLSWVFGTGEEKSQGSLDKRADADPSGPRYGIFVDGTTPQAIIFMIHNKTAQPLVAYITLTVDFIPGTAQQIQDADPLNRPMHELTGVLTGTTQDALPTIANNGILTKDYTSKFSGTLVASGSHMHPGGKWVDVVNMGPRVASPALPPGSEGTSPTPPFVCGGADLDGDGLPGVTLFRSVKTDANAAYTWPYSEDYQMGVTKFGFRAPIHVGDVIRQFGVYDVKRTTRMAPTGDVLPDVTLNTVDGGTHAWYEAMSYTGLYSDEAVKPANPDGVPASACSAASFAPTLIGSETGPATETLPTNHVEPTVDPWCKPSEVWPAADACDGPALNRPDGDITTTINIADFKYLPGDHNLSGALARMPLVAKDSFVHLVNEDVAIGVRHTFTSCPPPCTGTYVANFPLPDGLFDSGKLGNLDYIDGGIFDSNNNTIPSETFPTYDLHIDNRFSAGSVYSYFCSLHPWMRGSFKVVAAS